MAIHKVYEELESNEGLSIAKQAVDEAFDAVTDVLKGYKFKCANDDRAERLVEAIAVFLKESNRV